MTQPANVSKRNRTIILGVVCIAIIAAVTFVAITYYPRANNDQTETPPQDTYVPSLVMSGLQFKDDRSHPAAPFLHLTGRIDNTGNGTAQNVTISMYAIQSSNATAIETTVNLEAIAAGANQTIDLQFAYTGEALVAYNTPTLKWTN